MINSNYQKYSVILASLLHDIGKFFQRTENEIEYENSKILTSDTKNKAKDICPEKNEVLIHKHSLWTYEFLKSYSEFLPEFVEMEENLLITLAVKHHKPDSPLQKIIQIADCCSFGMDRQDGISGSDATSINHKNIRDKKLIPIFEFINDNDFTKEKKNRFPLIPLQLNENVFPQEILNQQEECLEYKRLWDSSLNDFKKLKNDAPLQYINSLMYLLKKYTWCIPSSIYERPDITLYDHLRTSAAIAGCLFEYYNPISEENEFNINNIEKQEPRFVLLNGDLSGIQKFIYKLSSKAAAKSLKGRSFYLQLLTDAIAKYVIDFFQMPDCNIIYSSGGGFYILLPVKALDKLEEIESSINNFILEKFNSEIYFVFGAVTLTINDFLEQKIGILWQKVKNDAEIKKQKKYTGIISENFNFFEPFAIDENSIEYVNKKYSLSKTELQILSDAFENNQKIPTNYIEFVRLGKDILNSKYMIELINSDVTGTLKNRHNIYEFMFNDYKVSYLFVDYNELFENDYNLLSIITNSGNCCKIEKFNDTFYDELLGTNIKYSVGFKFYGGNTAPSKEVYENGRNIKYIKTLNELTGGQEKSDQPDDNLHRIGILRMDVDNLGETFIRGFWNMSKNDETEQRKPSSISRIANLSFLLDYFFSGFINKILEKEVYKEKAYITYSGGDDLFIIGSWEIIPEIAKDIYSSFRRFVCYNKQLTLSGGIEITSPNYPIFRGAQQAGENESKAKQFRIYQDDSSKDSLFFISKALRLRDLKEAHGSDYAFVDKLKRIIVQITLDTGNKGFLGKLRSIYLAYLANFKNIQKIKNELSAEEFMTRLNYDKWRWRAAYSLARQKQSLNNNKHPDIRKNFEEIIDAIFNNHVNGRQYDRSIMDIIDVSTRWAELELRNKNI